VNGTGKTTTAAKLAHLLIKDGKRVLLAAADTFRAAAIDQLKVWGGRVGAEVVTKNVGADPAGIAYEALERAKAEGRDVLIIDTAGRLQNKSDLMAELAKIVRVLKKLDADAPHGVLLVLDATTGQNALSQVEIFREIAGVTGIVLTKLDGSARGGILVAIAERFGIPVNAIGIGEGIEDLRPFDAQDFARAIAGLDVKNAKAA
jgi:fused signal recognition particle receptor